MDLLTLRGVEVGYHRRPLLPPIDLTVRRGTFLGIVGPNGSGKTTLVRTLLGLLRPVAGRVEMPRGRRPRFGYVPQRVEAESRFPISVLDVVLMGRLPRVGVLRWPSWRDRGVAHACLERVGLGHLARKPLATLSGGQVQRTLIARALASEPEVLVLDEPTSGMDIVAERALLDLVESFRRDMDLGVVMVSHQLALVANFVSEVLLVDRERRAVEHGDVAEVVTPERLSRLYATDVVVNEIDGYRVVFLDRRRQGGA